MPLWTSKWWFLTKKTQNWRHLPSFSQKTHLQESSYFSCLNCIIFAVWRKTKNSLGVGKTKAIEITCWLRVNKSPDYTAEAKNTSWKFNTSLKVWKSFENQLFYYATWKCMRISNKPFVSFLWTLHSRLKTFKIRHHEH